MRSLLGHWKDEWKDCHWWHIIINTAITTLGHYCHCHFNISLLSLLSAYFRWLLGFSDGWGHLLFVIATIDTVIVNITSHLFSLMPLSLVIIIVISLHNVIISLFHCLMMIILFIISFRCRYLSMPSFFPYFMYFSFRHFRTFSSFHASLCRRHFSYDCFFDFLHLSDYTLICHFIDAIYATLLLITIIDYILLPHYLLRLLLFSFFDTSLRHYYVISLPLRWLADYADYFRFLHFHWLFVYYHVIDYCHYAITLSLISIACRCHWLLLRLLLERESLLRLSLIDYHTIAIDAIAFTISAYERRLIAFERLIVRIVITVISISSFSLVYAMRATIWSFYFINRGDNLITHQIVYLWDTDKKKKKKRDEESMTMNGSLLIELYDWSLYLSFSTLIQSH